MRYRGSEGTSRGSGATQEDSDDFQGFPEVFRGFRMGSAAFLLRRFWKHYISVFRGSGGFQVRYLSPLIRSFMLLPQVHLSQFQKIISGFQRQYRGIFGGLGGPQLRYMGSDKVSMGFRRYF